MISLKWEKRRVVYTLVALELLMIVVVSFWLVNKIKTRLNVFSPISAESIEFTPTDELKHFYEPKPGRVDRLQPSWLNEAPVVTINQDTLNERYDYELVKSSSTYRIVTLGDSWVYGQFVSTTDNFSEQLEDLLNETLTCTEISNFEVINLGVGSYDIAYAAERFNRRGLKYDPDLVVWLLMVNDFDEINEFIRPRVDAYKEKLQAVKHKLTYDEDKGTFGIFVDSNDPILAIAWYMARNDMSKYMKPSEIAEYSLAQLLKVPEIFSGSLLFYTLENIYGQNEIGQSVINAGVSQTPASKWYKSEITFNKETDQLQDQHPNHSGHQKIANDLLDYILQNEYIDCQQG